MSEALLLRACPRGIAVIAMVTCLSMTARAAEKTMTIDFVGDWCFDSQDKNVSWYKLPSWTEGGHCEGILSINKWGWYHADGSEHCEPIKVQLSQDTAPSGTGYTARVTARCQPDGPVTAGKLRSFEFHRYKGSLSVTANLRLPSSTGTRSRQPTCGA
jgi:hypothetical protein